MQTAPIRDGYDVFTSLLDAQQGMHANLAGVNSRLVNKGDLKLTDHAFFSTKLVTSSRIQLFEAQDNEIIGIRNMNNAKPEAGQCMLLEQIKLLGHVYTANDNPTEAYQGAAVFTNLLSVPGFQNAILTIRTDQKVIILKRPISDICEEDGGAENEKGTVTLRTPKFIIPDAQLEVTIELHGSVIPVRTILKVELKGLCTQTV